MRKRYVVGGVAVGLTLLACSAGPQKQWTPYPSRPNPPGSAEAAVPGQIGVDGEYLVGRDVPEGKYVSHGATDAGLKVCVWSTRSGDEKFLNGGALSGQQYVTLSFGQIFRTQGCQPWTPVT